MIVCSFHHSQLLLGFCHHQLTVKLFCFPLFFLFLSPPLVDCYCICCHPFQLLHLLLLVGWLVPPIWLLLVYNVLYTVEVAVQQMLLLCHGPIAFASQLLHFHHCQLLWLFFVAATCWLLQHLLLPVAFATFVSAGVFLLLPVDCWI